jgi:hypothetical protein
MEALSSYAFFGADVLSVSPGKVVAKVDGVPEGKPPDPPPGITAATARGNPLGLPATNCVPLFARTWPSAGSLLL